MRFDRRPNDGWLESGGCPFYFHPLPPRCAVTRMALGGRDVFDDDRERAVMSSHDCGGDMHSCPYVSAMWDVPDLPSGSDGHRTLVVPDLGIRIEVVDGAPDPTSEAIVIPTTRSGSWGSMGHDHGWGADATAAIASELSMYDGPFSLGTVVPTRGWGSGHSVILHAVVFDDIDGGGMTDLVIRSAVLDALSIAERIGVRSMEIRPMCIPLPDGGSLPDPFHVIAIPVTSIFSLLQAGRLAECERYRLAVLPSGMTIASTFVDSISGSVDR